MTMHGDDRGSGLVSILTLLSALVGTAVVAGLVGAGLFMPAVGAAGATARTGVDFFDALPAELEQSPLAQQSRILDADGHVIATFYNENRVVVPLKSIAPVMREAQIAIEDTRFREHGGIDPKGVLRAALNNASGDSTQGASTLTQQYVKLTLQENAIYAGDEEAAKAAVDKNLGRKIQEMKYAVALEKKMSKDQILEGYLNIAYYGDGAYGVETAARHFFSTTAAKLTLPQAALLAGLVQQPGAFDPRRNPKAATNRRNVVLARMLQTGKITQKQHDAAVKSKLGLKIKPAGNGCDGSKYPFFCNYVYRQVLTNKAFGATEQARRTLVFRGGLTIQTTLDPTMQAAAEKAVAKRVAARNKSNVAAAISVVEPSTGAVRAMAQSRPYGRDTKKGQTVVNYNVDNPLGGGNGFQTGSTFKAFTLAAALAEGKALNSTLDAPVSPHEFQKSDFQLNGSCTDLRPNAPYRVRNSEGNEHGTRTLIEFTAKSVNTAFVKLEGEVGLCKVLSVADNLGMHLANATSTAQPDGKPSTKLRPYESLTLGTEPVAPLTMASAYATFAADGLYCPPVSITAVTALGGKKIKLPEQQCEQALDPNVARGVTQALEAVITNGTARGNSIGRPAAGKTGTTNASTDLWFAGYVPQLAAAVWFGHPDKTSPMKNIDTGKAKYPRQMFGSTLSAPLWADFMKAATAGMPRENFGNPTDKILYGDKVSVPSTTGLSVADATKVLEAAGFSVSVGSPQTSNVAKGLVAGTNPSPGSRVRSGSAVTIYPSSGPAPAPPPPSATTPPLPTQPTGPPGKDKPPKKP
ncbi:MAG TPA: transglycosylase domain-containing protein [Angustibacter sp.]|nr:transglycosylase domain-containing protein [Angustibacter sp.]